MSGRTDPAAFPEHYGHVSFRRGSLECCALEQLYPGIRFNRVSVSIFARFYFEHAPDRAYVDVDFNISAAQEDLERHGFLLSRYAVRTLRPLPIVGRPLRRRPRSTCATVRPAAA